MAYTAFLADDQDVDSELAFIFAADSAQDYLPRLIQERAALLSACQSALEWAEDQAKQDRPGSGAKVAEKERAK